MSFKIWKMKTMNKMFVFTTLIFAFFTACNGGRSSGDKIAAGPSLDSIRVEGRRIAKASFEALSQKLMQALEAGGVANAVQFCRANAGPFTDSLSAKQGVRIKRVAMQYRNPNNAPNAQEKVFLDGFAALKAIGRDLKTADTAILLAPGRMLFAKPILLLPQCVACHGEVGKTLTEENYRLIRKQYPDDRAVGFSPGDLRGMWAIYFEYK